VAGKELPAYDSIRENLEQDRNAKREVKADHPLQNVYFSFEL